MAATVLSMAAAALITAGSTDHRVAVDLSRVTHAVNPRFLGCHSDSGYAHQSRGLYSQMILDESFESEQHDDPWCVGTPTAGLCLDTKGCMWCSDQWQRHTAPGNCNVSGPARAAGWKCTNSTRLPLAHSHSRPPPPLPFMRWGRVSTPGAKALYGVDYTAMNGLKAMRLEVSGTGWGGLSNRGNGGSGLFIEPDRVYQGYFFANTGHREGSTPAAAARVSLFDWTRNVTLGATTVQLPPPSGNDPSGWKQVHFNITTANGTMCNEVISCGGEFRIEIAPCADTSAAGLSIDFVFLEPGPWGLFQGLSVLRTGAELILKMGVRSMRQGGSFAGNSPWYEWDRWTGPVWARPSVGDRWGDDVIAGWGPFDMIDFANAAGIEPVMTTSSTTSTQKFADLVEYCHGNASTKMGRRRITDGHPTPYNVRYFELGNEGSDGGWAKDGPYVAQVLAMETRANQLGLGGTLFYLFPSGGPTYDQFLDLHDLAMAKALSPRLDRQMVDSIHTGHHPYYWGGGAAGLARHLFDRTELQGFELGAANTETNAKQQSQNRAMMEAGDLNDWFNVVDIAGRLHLRAASFCMGQGDGSDEVGFNQAMSSFLPNATWLQPPGWVHAMVSSTWQPNGLSVNVTAPASDCAADTWGSHWNDTFSASAARSDDGSHVVVRLVNNNTGLITVQLALLAGIDPDGDGAGAGAGAGGAPPTCVVTQLAADSLTAANSPAEPNRVVPAAGAPCQLTNERPSQRAGPQTLTASIDLLAHSFATVEVSFS